MTVIFNKRTGNIKGVFSGNLQHISTLYGDESQDYMLIWDEIIIDDDMEVLYNSRNYKVNLETKQIEMLPVEIRYPIASL